MSVDLLSSKFNDLLPPSINFDPNIISIGDVSDIEHVALLPIVAQVQVLSNLAAQPENVLDLMAFQFGVLFYAQANTISDPVARLALKLQLIQNSFNFNRRLGTVSLMVQLLNTIYGGLFLQEWYQYGGTHDHFRILTPVVLPSDVQANIVTTMLTIKRASQTMEGFYLVTTAPTSFSLVPGCYVQEWLWTPLGSINLNAEFVALHSSMVANANVQTSSLIEVIQIGAALTATARQLFSGAMVGTIAARITITATERLLRAILVLIKAGHG